MSQILPTIRLPKTRLTTGIFVWPILLVLFIAGMSVWLPAAVDWHQVFRPALLEIIAGRSPYNVSGFVNPPWAVLPLLPLVLLPEAVGRAVLVCLTLLAYTWIARKFGAGIPATILLLLSPPVVHGLLNGSLDWLAMLGFVLPPWLGLFLVSIKPQVGAMVVVFWVIEAWRKGGICEVIRMILPFTILLGASFGVYGFWVEGFSHIPGLSWNASFWPESIPVGLALMVLAVRKRQLKLAVAASPCLSPYVIFHSWTGALLAISASLPETAAAFIGLWLLIGIRALGG